MTWISVICGRLVAASVLAVIAVVAAHAASCGLALSARLARDPITRLVPARINNAPAALMLDTGASTTVLTPEAVRRLHVGPDRDMSEHFRGEPVEQSTMWGIGGTRAGTVVVANTFDLAALHGTRFRFYTAELGMHVGDGLLSTDFLQDFDIDLNMPANEIRLFRPLGDCERPKVYLQGPLFTVPLLAQDNDLRPRITVTIEGHDFTALLDTGASRTTIYNVSLTRAGINPPATKPHEIRGIGPHTVIATDWTAAAFQIGDLTVRHLTLSVAQDRQTGDGVDVLLGADLQRRIHFWIANSKHQLVIQYPPQPSPPVADP